MLVLIFYYLVLPFLLFALLLKFLKKYSSPSTPKEILDMQARDPMEPKTFRAIRLEDRFSEPGTRAVKLGDYETQDDAVDAALSGKSRGSDPQNNTRFLVLNSKGEILQEL